MQCYPQTQFFSCLLRFFSLSKKQTDSDCIFLKCCTPIFGNRTSICLFEFLPEQLFLLYICRFDYKLPSLYSQGFFTDCNRPFYAKRHNACTKSVAYTQKSMHHAPRKSPQGVSSAPSAYLSGFRARARGRRSGRKYRPWIPRILS